MLLEGRLTHTVLPDDEPLEIIDVGCGTGIWAIDMGDAFPNATIRGVEYVLPHNSSTAMVFVRRRLSLHNLEPSFYSLIANTPGQRISDTARLGASKRGV